MVSPELLRRYPFFAGFEPEQLKAIAMLGEDVAVAKDVVMFEPGQMADHFYLLLDGALELQYVVDDAAHTGVRREFYVGDFSPGEPFGISALLEPYRYTGRVRTTSRCRLLRMDAAGLRALCEVDPRIAARLMRRVAAAAMSRLGDTRVQLAATRA